MDSVSENPLSPDPNAGGINPPKKEALDPTPEPPNTDKTANVARSTGLESGNPDVIPAGRPAAVTHTGDAVLSPSILGVKRKPVEESILECTVMPMEEPVQGNDDIQLDSRFTCDPDIYNEKLKEVINDCLELSEDFDVRTFLTGKPVLSTNAGKENTRILTFLSKKIKEMAQIMADQKNITVKEAYQKLIGAIDLHEEKMGMDDSVPVKSTFAFRSALLQTSHQVGVGLDSWVVYTKSGKPENNIWSFVENSTNWIPEAQAAMGKLMETTITKALVLAREHPEQQVVLLKGGFGAGKTRQAGELYGSSSDGVIAPDKGKNVVHRSMPEVSHAAAHVHGSQVSHALFEELCAKVKGTVVYDSSLSRPDDLEHYIEAASEANKKVVVYDIARHDMARILSVLKRKVSGEDPRIPPDFIIEGAVRDKINRTSCMEVVIRSEDEDASTKPEYHFIGGNAQGWDTKEVMMLTPGTIELLEDAPGRLQHEGLEYDPETNSLKSRHTEDSLRDYFATEFERTVSDIVNELSPKEQEMLIEEFTKRRLGIKLSEKDKITRDNFYSLLSRQMLGNLSEADVSKALDSVSESTLEDFFHKAEQKIKAGEPLTYMDLPLKVALILHQNLKKDPWEKSVK